jgi:sigma-54 dependent dga operon transcriptional activator
LLWLLNKPLEGNIGQLKSDIQFLCAQAWAAGMTEHNDTLQLDKRLKCRSTPPGTASAGRYLV